MRLVRTKTIERFLRIHSRIAYANGLKVNILRRQDVNIEHVLDTPKTKVTFKLIDGVRVLEIRPKKIIDNKALVYLPGGAYVSGPIKLQVDFIRGIAYKTNRVAYLVNYKRAPEYTYKKTISEVTAVYKYALESHNNKDITVIGESAGGGLVLAFSMYLKEKGIPLPEKNVLLSPWLDVSLKNKEITKLIDSKDFVLSRNGLIEAGIAYAGDKSVDDYIISPINGDLYGLPKSLLQVGTNEILIYDCRDFKKKAKEQGLDLTYIEYKDMFHAFMAAPPFVDKVVEANKAIVSFIKE